MKWYYAHPINLYDTPTEKRDLQLIELLGLEVVNPNADEHQKGYHEQGWQYFLDLVETCYGIIFRACPDGRIGRGVHGEIIHAVERDKPILELPVNILARGMNKVETLEYLFNVGQR